MTIVLEKTQRRPRHERDAYVTPAAFAAAGLALVEGEPNRILDPGAGSGVWGEAARERWPWAHIIGVEIESSPCPNAYSGWWSEDYLDRVFGNYDLIMGNPPYAHAEQFIRRSLTQLNYGGVCVFLLRLAFLESQSRGRGLFREHPPERVSVCMKRPVFYGDGGGATAFCYMVWRNGHRGETRLMWSSCERTTSEDAR